MRTLEDLKRFTKVLENKESELQKKLDSQILSQATKIEFSIDEKEKRIVVAPAADREKQNIIYQLANIVGACIEEDYRVSATFENGQNKLFIW